MKFIYLLSLFLMVTLTANGQKKMENTYFTWDDFTEGFGKEMSGATGVYARMVKSGLKDNALMPMDFTFISDKKKNLENLAVFIKSHYPYTIEEVKPFKDIWEINGKTNPIPITADNLLFWVLDMYKRGYEFESSFDGYGGEVNNSNFPGFEKSQADEYFDKGVDCYNKGDLSGAIINWSLSIAINPKDVNAYYSRAIVKAELYTWKAALADYDKAISLAPDFTDALVNRGGLKDENGDYKGAIEDYDTASKHKDLDLKQKQMIYFNRGNSKFNLKDTKGACSDWKTAYELGANYAKERLDKNCMN